MIGGSAMVGSVFRYGVAQAVRTALPLSGGGRNAKGIGARFASALTHRPTCFAKRAGPDLASIYNRSCDFAIAKV